MNDILKIRNVFGITPTNTHQSAGMDFYIPNINPDEHDLVTIKDAFVKSYNIDVDEYCELLDIFEKKLTKAIFERHAYNIMHLYLALYSLQLNFAKKRDVAQAVQIFINEYLCFDNNGTPGVTLQLNDTLLINSGIRVILPESHAGIFFNKSGKGNQGYDVRACVVDEDYTGYVHLSVAMTKNYSYKCKENTVYCGDKLTQMVVLPVKHCNILEVNDEHYNAMMKNSQRGDNSFGSSDVKHE